MVQTLLVINRISAMGDFRLHIMLNFAYLRERFNLSLDMLGEMQ
jgi:hypothetical protein